VPAGEVARFEAELGQFLETQYPQIGEAITKEKALSDETAAALREAVASFKKTASF
jgi:F0F1-type ATP synthase alpha subunit